MLKFILSCSLFLAGIRATNALAIECSAVPLTDIKNQAANCLAKRGFSGDFSRSQIDFFLLKSLAGNYLEIITATSSDGSKKLQAVAECNTSSGTMDIIGIHGWNYGMTAVGVVGPKITCED